MDHDAASEPWWRDFRRQMPIADQWAYFAHAAVAPLSQPAAAALQEWSTDVSRHGAVHWSRWRQRVEEVRRLGATLLAAQTEEIALIRNTTEGVNWVAEGFPWQAGDNVVVPESEFPTNRYPWLNLASRGVETRLVPAPEERLDLRELEAACNERTRLIAVSWVGYKTGWRNDVAALAELAHRRGALLFLDAIQGLGVLPLDVTEIPVDFLAADGHKWLLGPEGAGLFYIRRKHLDRLRPIGVGWNSVQSPGQFENRSMTLKQSAGRYEGGTYTMGPTMALGASLELLLGYGIETVCERILQVTEELCRRFDEAGATIISSREENRRSGIIAVELPGRDPEAVRRQCLHDGVVVNQRAGRLRLSPHAYTNDEDIRRLMAALSRGE